MASSLEKDMEQIEECAAAIDHILDDSLTVKEMEEFAQKGTYIDRIVAVYLHKRGFFDWVDDEFNGPQINPISEKALMFLEQNRNVYHLRFNIISDDRNRSKYFRLKRIEPDQRLLNYKDIEDIETTRFDMGPETLESLDYRN